MSMDSDPNLPPSSDADNGAEGTMALVQTLRLGFLSLRVVMALLLVIYLFSGLFILPETEQAYVLRFGKVVTNSDGSYRRYTSGRWHLAFPEPIDRVVRVSVGKPKTVRTEDAFWYQDTTNIMNPEEAQADPGDPSATLKVGTDYYALTGDYNIIHTRWSLDYTVVDPKAYTMNYEDPDKAIQSALDNAVLKILGRTHIDDAMYAGSDALRTQVLDELQTILGPPSDRSAGGMGLGVVINTLNFDQKQPPRATIAAFTQVTQADQMASRAINEAQSYAGKRTQEAVGHASRMESEALSYKKRVVSRVSADTNYFQELLADNPDSTNAIMQVLYNKALADLVGNAKEIYVLKPGQQIRVMLNPQMKKAAPTNPGGPQ